ncbi:hypothetical protein V8F20_005394 [Naviculisporaceae sp. PSN 640]
MPSRHSGSCEEDSSKTKADDPDMSGKVILITGGTGGIGAELLVHLSHILKPPAHIIFTGRNTTSANAVIARCRRPEDSRPDEAISSSGPGPGPVQVGDYSGSGPEISFIPMDLSSLESVSNASNQILSLLQGLPGPEDQSVAGKGRLDILIANAGIMAHPPGLSTDGYEIQFATNHLGHALLIRKLLPLMLETANSPSPSSSASSGPGEEGTSSDVRIITTSSTGYRLGKIDNFPFEQLSNGDLFEGRTFFAKSLRYGNSKLANVVYARELALRYGDDAIATSAAVTGDAVPASTDTTNINGNTNINSHEDSTFQSGSPLTQTHSSQSQRRGILSISLTPGVVGTGLVNDLPLADRTLIYVSQLGKILTPEEGIRNYLWALSSPREEIVPGAFYEPVGKLWNKSWSDQIDKKDPLLGRKMWDWTEEVIRRWL